MQNIATSKTREEKMKKKKNRRREKRKNWQPKKAFNGKFYEKFTFII